MSALKDHLVAASVISVDKKRNDKVGLTIKRSNQWNAMYVKKIHPTSKFANTKLKEGMVILTVNGNPCPESLVDLIEVIQKYEGTLRFVAAKTSEMIDLLGEDSRLETSPDSKIGRGRRHSLGDSSQSSGHARVDFTGTIHRHNSNEFEGTVSDDQDVDNMIDRRTRQSTSKRSSRHTVSPVRVSQVSAGRTSNISPLRTSQLSPVQTSQVASQVTRTSRVAPDVPMVPVERIYDDPDVEASSSSGRRPPPYTTRYSNMEESSSAMLKVYVFSATKQSSSQRVGLSLNQEHQAPFRIFITRVDESGMFPAIKQNSILYSVNDIPANNFSKMLNIITTSTQLKLEVMDPPDVVPSEIAAASPTASSGSHSRRVEPRRSARPGLIGYRQGSIIIGRKEIEIETPPKGVVVIWILIAAELVFDLVTSAIAFSVFLRESKLCCGEEIISRINPLYTSIPFAFLVLAELLFLFRAMRITLWPPQQEVEEEEDRSICNKIFCFLKGKKSSFITFLINCLTVINPFFGFLIAWMLLYQTDEKEAYLVIGLECATIILHFVSVHYEGHAQTFFSKLYHAIIIIPFLASGLMVAWYVQLGGICYNASVKLFWYDGCEVCPDTGMPPINGTMCAYTEIVNGTNTTVFREYYLWELDQATKCTDEVQMCFFDESYQGESELFG